MDRPRDYYTKGSKINIKAKINIIHHLYVESKKMIQMNLCTKQKQTYRLQNQTYGYQRGRGGGINMEFGCNRYTPLHIK